MAELLLERLSEEIPARMQARAADDLKRLVSDGLKAAGLAFKDARAFATPRRLALVVDGLPTARADVSEERRGPRVASSASGMISSRSSPIAGIAVEARTSGRSSVGSSPGSARSCSGGAGASASVSLSSISTRPISPIPASSSSGEIPPKSP